MAFLDRIKHAWNAFTDEPLNRRIGGFGGGASFGTRPDRQYIPFSAEKTIISSILTRLSIDVASVNISHVRTDEDGRYLEDMQSGLNNCLTVEANIDQGAYHFRQHIAEMLFDEGVAAIVPIDASFDPTMSNTYDIKTMRVGKVVEWFPQMVRVEVYNETKGYREQITLPKQIVAIVENPLYRVMNEPNSTLKRLVRKLNLLDVVDEQASSGKLDLIIQLPYVIKSDARRQQAEQRRKDIEAQLQGSKYGIAYADGTEKIQQLNRPADNNLLSTVDYLTKMLYAQLGLTDEIMNGTANESTMLNYIDRTIRPVMIAITEAMKRTFLTKTARSQGQSIMYFRDPFSLVPMSQISEIADVFSRNEILSPNDIRTAIGLKPSKDPKANQLANSNMPAKPGAPPGDPMPVGIGGNSQNGT